MFHVKLFFLFVIKNIFANANIFCRGAAPADPAKGVPPFGTSLRALRGRESAVKGKNNFKIRLSREKAFDNFNISPFLRSWVLQR